MYVEVIVCFVTYLLHQSWYLLVLVQWQRDWIFECWRPYPGREYTGPNTRPLNTRLFHLSIDFSTTVVPWSSWVSVTVMRDKATQVLVRTPHNPPRSWTAHRDAALACRRKFHVKLFITFPSKSRGNNSFKNESPISLLFILCDLSWWS